MRDLSLHEANIRAVLSDLECAGYTCWSVDDGGDDLEPVTSVDEAVAAVMAVDDAKVLFGDQWIYFTICNDADEVIVDHTCGAEFERVINATLERLDII